MAPHRIATPPEDDTDMCFSLPSSSSRRPLLPGIYAPTPCFFLPNEEVDTATIMKHTVRLAQAGLAGITTQGSNGEAVHLAPSERSLVTLTTRCALDSAGFFHLPVIVGCGAQSTRECIQLCHEAAEAGGDYALVLPPSYYKASYPRSALQEHFESIASASPIPIVIYNYPGAASGLDLDSDLLIELAEHPNITGVKLTCGNVGKLARIAAATSTNKISSPSTFIGPGASSPPFLVLAGSADFLLPALSASGSGALAGLANIAPKACVALYEAYTRGKMAKAWELQSVLARADWVVQKGGVVGTKAGLDSWFGYGGYARKPLPRWGRDEVAENRKGLEEVMRLERSL